LNNVNYNFNKTANAIFSKDRFLSGELLLQYVNVKTAVNKANASVNAIKTGTPIEE